jgi:predicted transcriptional regulator
MKLKRAIIVIEDSESTDKRWSSALKGKEKTNKNENIIVCSSLKIAEKIFSEPRLSILKMVARKEMCSIKELATNLKRDFKNVYHDVMFLADLGLISLEESKSGRSLKPISLYENIELSLAA